MKITQEKTHPINRWHQSLEKKDLNILYDLLADDFQFYSPVVFKPKDKHMGFIYLIAASETFLHADDFHYEKEISMKIVHVLNLNALWAEEKSME